MSSCLPLLFSSFVCHLADLFLFTRLAISSVNSDNTMMSPYLMRPLELGADISYDSGTKYLSGHHDLMAGVISCDREDVGKDIAFTINAVGNALTPLDCFLLLRGIKTLAVRMDRQQTSSYRVANYLEGLGFKVNYPGLASHPGKDIHDQQAAGPGAVLSFETFDDDVSKRIVGAARLWGISVSFGCVNSLISMPCLMSHASIPAEVRKARRLPEDLIRLCVGIEDPRDLIDDLQSALLAAGAIRRRDGLPSNPTGEEENELEYVRLYERVPVNTEAEVDYLAAKTGKTSFALPLTPTASEVHQNGTRNDSGPQHAGGDNVNVHETRGAEKPNSLTPVPTATAAKERSDPDTTSDAIEASAAPGWTSLVAEEAGAADGSVLPQSPAHGVGTDHSSTLPSELIVSAPGKVILFGEHAVVHGVPAVAGALDLRCYAHVAGRSDGVITLAIPDVDASFKWNAQDLPWSALPKTLRQSHVEDGTDLPPHADESLDVSLRQAVEAFVERSFPTVSSEDIKSRQARGSAIAFLYLYMCIAGPSSGAKGQGLTFRSALPLSAGLGSSAAYSSCLATSLIFSHGHLPLPQPHEGCGLDGTTKAVLNSWAFLAEKILHGTPSGVDNTVAVYGGAVVFTRAHARNDLLRNQIEQLGAHHTDAKAALHTKAWRLLLTDTRVARDTKRLVASVSNQLATEPSRVGSILDRIEDITTQASALLSLPPSVKSERALGTLFAANHKALEELQVSHPALEKVKSLALDSPLKLSTKLTGAGGGGCAITLLPSAAAENQITELEHLLIQAGFQPRVIEVGGPGVGVYIPRAAQAASHAEVASATWFATHSGQDVAQWAGNQAGWVFA